MSDEKIRLSDIRTLTDLIKKTSIKELNIQSKSWSVKLCKQTSQPESVSSDLYGLEEKATHNVGKQIASLILSPSLGIFLSHHPTDKKDIVMVGEKISVNQRIGFLKVGPIYLPVTSPFDGQVKEIYVGHGDLVGFEDKLISINQ